MLKCRRISDGIEFAVKRVSKTQSFENEDQIYVMQQLNHRSIIKLIDWFEDSDNVYIVMELASGGDLCDRIMQRGGMAEKDAAFTFMQILSAIGYMHSCNMMHCDIKPDNILRGLQLRRGQGLRLRIRPAHRAQLPCSQESWKCVLLCPGGHRRPALRRQG